MSTPVTSYPASQAQLRASGRGRAVQRRDTGLQEGASGLQPLQLEETVACSRPQSAEELVVLVGSIGFCLQHADRFPEGGKQTFVRDVPDRPLEELER